MAYTIDIQHAIRLPSDISDQDLHSWITQSLENFLTQAELTIRIVSTEEMAALNQQYRKKSGPTNVLSFPNTIPPEILQQLKQPFLGDLLICPAVLEQESFEQNKLLKDHWAHIVIHGVLHLLGYDHIQADDEKIMQHLEINLLQQLGIGNPYD